MSDRETQDEPVMDGALDDMSDGGTPKTEASDLMEEAGVDEVDVQQQGLEHGVDDGSVQRGEAQE